MKVINKPWGKEEWLELNDKYCYKRIYINSGYKTSYQYHNFKRETNYIISGEAEIWLENDNGIVEKTIMSSGDYFNVAPTKKHRVIALTDLILQEVSTPEVDDVVRIEDDTKRINGKIDGEHENTAVLIICAGLGSRLESLTKYVNKTLLPINNKAIISHIINYFPDSYDFIITKGYKGDSIEDYCKITHPNHNFTFVEIDKIDGIGTGPGYSALKCKEYLQRPFYFITGDCLIDSKLPYLDSNWLGVYPTSYPEKYSTIKVDIHDNIISFKNKTDIGNDLAFIGFGGIINYDIFWNELENNISNGELVSVFNNIIKYPTLKAKKLKWLDTGNLDDLMKTRSYFNDRPLSLTKSTNEITYSENNKFLKFIPNNVLLKNRVERSEYLKHLIPKNFGYTNNFIYYDWIKGKTLYELDSFDVFEKFLIFLEKNLESIEDCSISDLQDFYITKTINRLNIFLDKYNNNYMTTEYTINGLKYPNMYILLDKIKDVNIYKNNNFYKLFHGDLQFDNIIYNEDEDNFKYIDWRDSFGNNIKSGDLYYDLAKLYGGLLIPYNLMKDENNITLLEGTNNVEYSFNISENLEKFRKIYEKWLITMNFDIKKIKFITGVIFLNMSPLHDEKFGKLLWFKSIEMISEYSDEHK